MRGITLALVAILFSAAAPVAQQTVPTSVERATVGDISGAWVIYAEQGRADFVTDDGVSTSMKTSTEGKDKDQVFITRWTDANGFEHEVRTEYGGRTNGGRQAAAERHKAAVDEQVRLFGGPST